MDRNVRGEELEDCSKDPMTGWFRDGCCRTDSADHGSHTVCVIITQEFLDFSKSRGNDLITPVAEYGFPGLIPGNQWCLCANRWLEAYLNGVAPKVKLESTHQKALEVIELSMLEECAVGQHA